MMRKLLIKLLGGYTEEQLEYNKAMERYFECRRIRLYIDYIGKQPMSQFPMLVREFLLKREDEREKELININE